jgi:hypothetical protein
LERGIELCRTWDILREGLAVSGQLGNALVRAHALQLRAELCADVNPSALGQAEAYERQALALTQEPGKRPLQARCHLGLGKLHRPTGPRRPRHDRQSRSADEWLAHPKSHRQRA